MNLKGKWLVRHRIPAEMRFEHIDKIDDYKGSECIVVPFLDPDFTVLLDKVRLIISKRGSKLAHLAIVASEYGVGIIISKSKLKKRGKIQLKKENGEIYFEVT